MIRLAPTQRPLEALRAIAASGASGLAKSAQRQLIERRTAELQRELGR